MANYIPLLVPAHQHLCGSAVHLMVAVNTLAPPALPPRRLVLWTELTSVFFFMEQTVSLTVLPLLLESWCSGINSGQRASSNTSAAVGNMRCTAGGQSFQLKKEFSPSRNL